MINSSTDVQSIAYQFVQADRAAQDKLFAGRKSTYEAKLKAYNSISSKVNELKTALNDLSKSKQFEAYSVTQSAEGYAKITAGANTASGQYQINIDQLGTAHQVALNFSSETAPITRTGTLTLGVGTGDDAKSFTLDMSTLKEGATLSDLRDAINKASDNPGVRATLVRSGDSVKLLVSSEETGSSNTLTLSASDNAEMTNAINSMTVVSTAQDAKIRLGGTLELTSATNKFENVIDGLTIDITKTHEPGEVLTFTVGQDLDATKEQLQKLVDGYNAVVNTVSSQNDSKTLSGDSTTRMLLSQMRSELSQFNLYQLGLEYDRSGKLSLNSSKLENFLQENPEGLTQVLSGEKGLLKSLSKKLDSFTKGDSALLNSAKNTVQSNLDRLQDRMDRFDLRMEQLYNRYVNQFSQMQTLILQMEQTFGMF